MRGLKRKMEIWMRKWGRERKVLLNGRGKYEKK